MKKFIGEVGVDSGQILICDPCYIDSQWKKENVNFDRTYEITERELFLKFGRDFSSFEEPILCCEGKTMNQMVANGEAHELPETPAKHPFSYNACCKKTCGDDEDGQLNYEMGHPGVGVVTRSGYGDGVYPVHAEYTSDGRVKSITVTFIDEEE